MAQFSSGTRVPENAVLNIAIRHPGCSAGWAVTVYHGTVLSNKELVAGAPGEPWDFRRLIQVTLDVTHSPSSMTCGRLC